MKFTYKLEDYADVINGGAWSESEYASSGIKVVKVTNMTNGTISDSSLSYLPLSAYEAYKAHRLFTGDLVLATVGSHPDQPNSVVGRTAIIPKRLDGAFLNQNAACIRVKDKKRVDPGYLTHLSRTTLFKHHIESRARGSANQVRLAIGELRKFTCEFPSLPTQRKITAILSAYDDLIENNKRRIAILENMAEELYREWFVRLRFPGHEKVKMVKVMPEGWEAKSIGEIIEHQIGGGWGSEIPTGTENVPVYILRGTDFKNFEKGNFGTAPLRYEKQSSVNSRSLKHGDIVLENSVNAQSRCTGNTIIITQKILDQFEYPVIPASFCKLIRFKEVDLAFYLWKQLKCLYDQGLMEYFQNVATNGIANFQVGRFLERFEVKLPSDKYSCKAFWSYDTSIYKVTLTNLQKSRDRLLSRLMSGKIDVENLDIQFPSSMQEEVS